MPAERLRAKSRGPDGRPPLTIRRHTLDVLEAAERLVDVTGAGQLAAVGLDPAGWLPRFRREVLLAALLHDLGKANDHFQGMVRCRRGPDRPQGLRHEAVSYLLARLPELQGWLAAVADPRTLELVLWAVAGHHRKFPPDGPPEGCGAELVVHLGHDDFGAVLALGERRLGLGPPPSFDGDRTWRLTRARGVFSALVEARAEAERAARSLSGEERRYVAALKACLIGADVAGSIRRRGAEPMADWIGRAFDRVPGPDELESIVARRLEGKPLRPFQEAVADRPERVVLVLAGCGSGKTLAAYLRAARRWPGRRLFVCYPTTGTATEGYRDYLADPELEAELVHGRAEVDMELLDLGDDEPDAGPGEGGPGRAARDSAGALEQWSTPLVGCTVDAVLGLVQNMRRGLYAWPSLARSGFVFDEIHAYDEALFGALLRFLVEVPGVPCLLMTASLPAARRDLLRAALAARGEPLGVVAGPPELEAVPRYIRTPSAPDVEAAWAAVEKTLAGDGKVLWVVNTVAAALALAADPRAARHGAMLYHSRFRYRDRVERHRDVIEAFRAEGPALAIATQVAEMPLDLSADLLLSELAPIPALIQRLGRLNRRARPDGSTGTRPLVAYEPAGDAPYEPEELEEARRWLAALGDGPLSQADLAARWADLATEAAMPPGGITTDHASAWIDGGFVTGPRPLREASPGIEVILESDVPTSFDPEWRPEKVRIPMALPRDRGWRTWPQVAFCRVPPAGRISYDPLRGAAWTD